VRLSKCGYTLVAKGVEGVDYARQQHENKIYDRLQAIQGKHVPVCLGSIDFSPTVLLQQWRLQALHVYELGWRPLFDCSKVHQASGLVKEVTRIFKAVHRQGVFRRDAEACNILYDAHRGTFMVVDFERAEFRGRQTLGAKCSNTQNRKRKRGVALKREKDDFARELDSALENVSRFAQH